MTDKRKLCFIVQRYGLEVNGGAEYLCRKIAEKMNGLYSVEVLTTKAVDYITWQDAYEKDNEVINGVSVKRFSVEHPRDVDDFAQIDVKQYYRALPVEQEEIWVEKQGPAVPALIQYIKDYKDEYDAFVFFTYLYYPTVMGIPAVKEKSIVFPFAHDERFLNMKIYQNVFLLPKAFIFETEDERSLIRKRYHNYDIPYFIGGAGVDVPSSVFPDQFKEKYNLNRYIVYVGRIDTGKNCDQLFDYFIKYKEEHPSDLKLVLIGKEVIEVPKREDIVSCGFVSEQDKFDGIAGAELLVLPSKFESLSIVVLEAFSLMIPILVNGECDVLKTHCKNSNGGMYYESYEEFEENLTRMLNDPDLRKKMGILGKKYVNTNYNWDIIISKINDLVEYVINDQYR